MTRDNWRDAKIPQKWKDAIEADMAELRLRAAFAWPREARPTPVPFRWGDYDRLTGTVVPGTYYRDGRYGRAEQVMIRLATAQERQSDRFFGQWMFSYDGSKWREDKPRDLLFATKRDALLNMLWDKCDAAARELDAIIRDIDKCGAAE